MTKLPKEWVRIVFIRTLPIYINTVYMYIYVTLEDGGGGDPKVIDGFIACKTRSAFPSPHRAYGREHEIKRQQFAKAIEMFALV